MQWTPDVMHWEETVSIIKHSCQEMGLDSSGDSMSLD